MFLQVSAMDFSLLRVRYKVVLPIELKLRDIKHRAAFVYSTRLAACQLSHITMCIITAKLQIPVNFADCDRHYNQKY